MAITLQLHQREFYCGSYACDYVQSDVTIPDRTSKSCTQYQSIQKHREVSTNFKNKRQFSYGFLKVIFKFIYLSRKSTNRKRTVGIHSLHLGRDVVQRVWYGRNMQKCNYKNIKFTDRKFNIFRTSVTGTDNKFTTHTNSFKLHVSFFCEIGRFFLPVDKVLHKVKLLVVDREFKDAVT